MPSPQRLNHAHRLFLRLRARRELADVDRRQVGGDQGVQGLLREAGLFVDGRRDFYGDAFEEKFIDVRRSTLVLRLQDT